VDLFVGKQSLKEMLVGKRRWLWLLGAGAAVCGGSYMIYTAWCAVPLPIRINIRTPCFANRQHTQNEYLRMMGKLNTFG